MVSKCRTDAEKKGVCFRGTDLMLVEGSPSTSGVPIPASPKLHVMVYPSHAVSSIQEVEASQDKEFKVILHYPGSRRPG